MFRWLKRMFGNDLAQELHCLSLPAEKAIDFHEQAAANSINAGNEIIKIIQKRYTLGSTTSCAITRILEGHK